MGRERALNPSKEATPQSIEVDFDHPTIQEKISVRSPAVLIDELFIIASALRCRSLPCTMRKVEKNPDLLTRQTVAMLKSLGYEEDEFGLTEGSLFRILPHADDGIMKVAQVIRLPDGAKSPWGGVFAPTGSGFEEAASDLIEAINYAEAKVEALTKALYIQVEFLRFDPKLMPILQIIHDSIIHYDDAKNLVTLNPEFASEMVQLFGVDSISAGIMSQSIMNA